MVCLPSLFFSASNRPIAQETLFSEDGEEREINIEDTDEARGDGPKTG